MEFMELMGLLAFMSTMGLYATSLPLFPLLLTQRRPDLVQFSSLVLRLLNNAFSFHYAVLAAVHVSALSNGIGILLHIPLIMAYLHVAPSKAGPYLFLLIGVGFYAGVGFFNLYDKVFIGLTSSSVRTLAYASPALTVASAARTGNVDALDTSMACGALVCFVTWYVFGALIDDPFVKLPNVPGIVVQLAALFLLWKDEQKKKEMTRKGETMTGIEGGEDDEEKEGRENGDLDVDNNVASKKTN